MIFLGCQVKLAFMEIGDIFVQLNGLFSGSHLDDAAQVYLSSVIIGANLFILAATILVCNYIFNSSSAALGATLVVEVLFDKIYVGVAVFLRFDTISNADLDAWGQLIQHLTVLVPGVLTALDIKDALDLSDFIDFGLRDRRRAGIRMSAIQKVRNRHKQQTEAPRKRFHLLNTFFIDLKKVSLLPYLPHIALMGFGLFLCIYTGTKYA